MRKKIAIARVAVVVTRPCKAQACHRFEYMVFCNNVKLQLQSYTKPRMQIHIDFLIFEAVKAADRFKLLLVGVMQFLNQLEKFIGTDTPAHQ